MPRSSTGNFTLASATFISQTSILASSMNTDLNDIATALTQSIATNGSSKMTAPIVLAQGTAAAPSIVFSNDLSTGFYGSATDSWTFVASGTGIFSCTSAGITMLSGKGGNFIDKNNNNCYALPLGVLAPFAGSVAPNGWLLCYGQAISRTTYANLFTVISTTYGTGDGSTTFNLPDFRGRVSACQDPGNATNNLTNASTNGVSAAAMGNTGGLQTSTVTIATLPSYTLPNTLTATIYGGGNIAHSTGTANIEGAGGTTVVLTATQTISAPSVTGNVSFAGSNTPFNTVQPTIGMNYMIYHGVYS